MTSSVFFKFKSQKEPSRVEFDGTGISVFELKREIIIKSGLGSGTDFDLAIYTDEGSDAVEYDDDTTIIPRSTTVVARRLPPLKPGAGRAARYVTGKMPASAKNSSRRETAAKPTKPSTNGLAQMSTAMTEEEKMMAMFNVQSDQWNAQQEEMSHQTAVFKPGAKKNVNVPNHDPPNGYVCFRCGQKGHWIMACPTNDNPEYDNRPRVKRTTGIPRSFLKTVDKSALQQTGADGEEVKPPTGVMVNSDGDFVIAEPDKAAWEQYQAKTKSSAAAQKEASVEEKELEEKGLLCPIDKRMFIDPMKTPCCQKTYCNECINNALTIGDLVCPGCQTEGVIFEELQPDEEAAAKMAEFLKEIETAKDKTKERSKSPTEAKSPASQDQPEKKEVSERFGNSPDDEKATQAPTKSKSPTPTANDANHARPVGAAGNSSAQATTRDGSVQPNSQEKSNAKKRPAEELMENPKVPKGPKAMQRAQDTKGFQQNMMPQGMNGMNGMNMGMGMGMMNPNMMFPMNGMNGFQGDMNNMNMQMMMGNPMMNQMMGYNNFNGGGFPNMDNGMFGGNYGGNMNMNGGGFNNGHGHGHGHGHGNNNRNYNNRNPQYPNRPNFTAPSTDDDAYFRKPVNPNRHQNRQRRVRPSDYREL